MENEFSTVMDDGRILQKDNAIFQGKELARVDPAEAEESLRYFVKQFADIEKYVDTRLKTLRDEERGSELLARLKQLREEAIAARAIGDFETLVGKIDTMIDECAPQDTGEAASAEREEALPAQEDPESLAQEDPESLAGLAELAARAVEVTAEGSWQQMQSELENIRFKWNQLTEEDPELVSQEGYAELNRCLDDAHEKVAERKAEWLEKKRERRRLNMDNRAKIVDQLQDIVDRKRWQAFKQVSKLAGRWEEIRDVPDEPEAHEQQKKYDELVQEFNDKKVAFLVRKAQKEEENLIGKLAVLDKINQIVTSVGPDTTNWARLDSDMEELSRQWRKIGHVPGEQSDTVWERFKSVRDSYFALKMEHNKDFRAQTEKNIRKKVRLCELAEALLEEQDLAVAVREINNLHKKWKKAGAVPKEENDRLWERFNEASRKFNEKKLENLEVIRDQEQENLKEKMALCEKAEVVSTRTDWNDATAEMDALMKAWKESGPVPRRKAGKLWNRFKKAMDTFYNNRREHFRSIREDQKENYDKKKQIVDELVKLGALEDAEEAVQQAKPLQEQFRQVGFVPIKKKQKIDREYKEACDRIYQRSRATGRRTDPVSDPQVSADKTLRADFFRLRKECDNLHDEILRYQDTKTFINPGGKGNDLIDEIQQKIDSAQSALEKKQEKLEELRQKLDG